MKTFKMLSTVITLLLTLTFYSAVANGAQLQGLGIQRVVVFGDSLLDSGNNYALTMKDKDRPVANTGPIAPYWHGHYSNGYNAADYLYNYISNVESATYYMGGVYPDHSFSMKYNDYAIGGATTSGDGSGVSYIKSVSQQVIEFLGNNKKTLNQHDLILIDGGGDNFLYLQNDPKLMFSVVSDLQSSISRILAAYPKVKIIVYNLPDITTIPAWKSEKLPLKLMLKLGIKTQILNINHRLLDVVKKYRSEGFHISILNLHDLLNTMKMQGRHVGITDTSNPMVKLIGQGNGKPLTLSQKEQAKYLFFDEVHPSAHAEHIIAQTMFYALNDHLSKPMYPAFDSSIFKRKSIKAVESYIAYANKKVPQLATI